MIKEGHHDVTLFEPIRDVDDATLFFVDTAFADTGNLGEFDKTVI